jgi:hypothetical protein
MATLILENFPQERVLEVDAAGALQIIDPYLLFYLRWSRHLTTSA